MIIDRTTETTWWEGDAELLVYLVDEEEDIYIGVLVVVCRPLNRAQPS